jgi:hypothetical protein
VRIKNATVAEPEVDRKPLTGAKRKRKQSELEQHLNSTPLKMAPTYEIFPPGETRAQHFLLVLLDLHGYYI